MSGAVGDRFSLSQRFAVAGALVLLVGCLVIGGWVVRRITEGVTANAAISTALLVDSLVAPLTQELDNTPVLSIGPVRALDELMRSSNVRDRIVSFKIWRSDGTIAYSDDFEMIGRNFPPNEALTRAAAGEVVAEFDNLDEPESQRENAIGIPLLEIYSPIREPWTGTVIAVAEFYEDGTYLQTMIDRARWTTALVVGGTGVLMGLILFGIVHTGTRTIARQRGELEREIERKVQVSEQNRTLRERVERAYSLSTELNERYLRRVSADLHDGPAQLVGLASLRIGTLRDAPDDLQRKAEATIVQQVLADAMSDIRTICSGLSLPHIDRQSLADIVWEVARAHERRTGTTVDLAVSGAVGELPLDVKVCIYRFVQEGLNNAFRHAQGVDQAILCHVENGVVHLSVQNGPFEPPPAGAPRASGHLGLDGLRTRVEAIGGSFSFEAFPETGSRLEMSVDSRRLTQ